MVMLWFFSFSFLLVVGCGSHGGACGLWWWWVVVATMVVMVGGMVVVVVEEMVVVVFCALVFDYFNE